MKQFMKHFAQTFLVATFLFLIACSPDKNNQPQRIALDDMNKFGGTLVGKQISFDGIIYNAYSCQLPENIGNQCLELHMPSNQKEQISVIIKNNTYTIAEYKNWIDSKAILSFTGKVELKDGASKNYKEHTKSPVLIVSKIENK